jgi:hypothetical protein
VNVQEHHALAESHYARHKDYLFEQKHDSAIRALLAANYHATMVLATAKIAELETGR